MTTKCRSKILPNFFNVLDNQFEHIMAPFSKASLESWMGFFMSKWTTVQIHGKIPPTFPNQWIRSCIAINSTSGSINWVDEGVLAMSMESEKVWVHTLMGGIGTQYATK